MNDVYEVEQESAFRNEAPETDEPLYLDDENMLVAGNPDEQKAEHNDAMTSQASDVHNSVQKAVSATAKTTSASITHNADKAASKVPGRGEMYVHTWGAQGEVWGTVVMNGNTGRGTIHDQDEHTYAIRVVRRGANELVGTDQNGREYIFKL